MTDYAVPPPELVQQWMTEFYGTPIVPGEACTNLAIRAAQWGADTELEACCEWLDKSTVGMAELLRAARRPKPPSLKQQAMCALIDGIARGGNDPSDIETIRRALEALPE
jgi:hypothetical protein